VYLFSVALINIVVDPFYIFRTPFFRVQAQINDRYAKIEFLKKEKGRFNSYIMGSSRMLHTYPDVIGKYIPAAKFYNLATVFGTMYEHLLHVKYFIENGYPVKNLYVGLDMDFYSVAILHDYKDCRLKLHRDVLDKNPIDFYWSYVSTLQREDVKQKLRVNFGKKASFKYEIEKDGALALEPGADNTRVFFENPASADKIRIKDECLKGNLESLRELMVLCKKHHINLILFITPYRKDLMGCFVEEDYITVLRDLFKITPIWDFSGYNSVTMDNENYHDFSHYKPSVSRLIAARIFHDQTLTVPKDFGIWVTEKNIDAHLENVRTGFKNKGLPNGGQRHYSFY
jgi:hypothetical protein